MKKFGIFFLGLLTGVCLTIIASLIISRITSSSDSKLAPVLDNQNETISTSNDDSEILSEPNEETELTNLDYTEDKIEDSLNLSDYGLNLLNEPGKVINAKKIVTFQTLDPVCALAYACNNSVDESSYHVHGLEDLLVLYVSTDLNSYLYDDQVIDVDENSEVIQVGTYRYQTINKEYDQYKTVPVVIIRETSNINDIT